MKVREPFQRTDGFRSVRHVTGRQPYHVDVPGVPNANHPSVVPYDLSEGMCVPYEITIELTHPEQLTRTS